jgi:RNA polymerase sigma factor (sigma-70 family)
MKREDKQLIEQADSGLRNEPAKQPELYRLIDEARAGDVKAFEALYCRYAKKIVYHAKSILKNDEDAEDAAQEIVIRMFKSLPSLKSPYAFTSWLHKLITDGCYDWLQKNKRHSGHDDITDYSEELPEDARERLPEASAEDESQRTQILSVIHSLPPIQQRTVAMYYYEEMSYKEIAKALGVTVATVSTNIMKAKRKIKDGLKGVAFSAAIAQAVQFDIEHVMAEDAFGDFIRTTDVRLENAASLHDVQVSTGTEAHGFGAKMHALLIGISAAAVVAVILVFHPNLTPAESIPPGTGEAAWQDETVATQTDTMSGGNYIPDAVIGFTDGDCPCGHVNPQEGELFSDDPDLRVISWEVIDGSGAALESGQAAAVASPLSGGLPPGTYVLRYTVENADGQKAYVQRQFDRIEGPIPPGLYE